MSEGTAPGPAADAAELARHLRLLRSVGVGMLSAPPQPAEAVPAARAPAPRRPAPEPAPARAEAPRAPRPPEPAAPRAPRPPAPVAPQAPPTPGSFDSLDALQAHIGHCVRCPLAHQGRNQVVFGAGDPSADVLFVGEGPGYHEDRQGIPFVGRAGRLLTDIIEKGMKIPRAQVYIANIVKCRPPNNRDPTLEEVSTCRPFVLEQIRLVRPKVIVALGRVAYQALLLTSGSIMRNRGRWHEVEGTPVMPTLHPAFLLRNPAGKKDVWADIQEVLRALGGPDGR